MQWTEEVWTRVDALLAEGKNHRQIAEHLGVTHQSVRHALHLRPTVAIHREPIDDAGRQLIREHYGRDWTAMEIAQVVGCTQPSVIHCAHQMGLVAYPQQHRRSRNGAKGAAAAKAPPQAAEKSPAAAPGGRRDADTLPAGHPLTWGTLQSFLSPENRQCWPGSEENLPRGTAHRRRLPQ